MDQYKALIHNTSLTGQCTMNTILFPESQSLYPQIIIEVAYISWFLLDTVYSAVLCPENAQIFEHQMSGRIIQYFVQHLGLFLGEM